MMLEKILKLLADNPLYVAGGFFLIVLLMINDKLRKYVGKLVSLVLTVLILYLAYIMVTQWNKPAGDENFDSGTGKQTLGNRKSMYYSDPEERMQNK